MGFADEADVWSAAAGWGEVSFFLNGFHHAILSLQSYGRGGIRTPEGLSPLTVFETVRFNRSRTLPEREIISFQWSAFNS